MSQCAKNFLINKFQFAELNKKVSYTHPYLSRTESISKNKNLVQNDSPAVFFHGRAVCLYALNPVNWVEGSAEK